MAFDREHLGRIADLVRAHGRQVAIHGNASTVASWATLRAAIVRLVVALSNEAAGE